MMTQETNPIHYNLELTTTASATGYFSCKTGDDHTLEEMIAYLRHAPMDEFMHNQVLGHLSALPQSDQARFFEDALQTEDTLLLALCSEAGFVDTGPLKQKKEFAYIKTRDLLAQTPLIAIKSKTAKDHKLHSKWIEVFRENIFNHVALKKDYQLPAVFEPAMLERAFSYQTDIDALYEKYAAESQQAPLPMPSPGETAQKALDILNRVGILEGEEMRHEASLSPIALIRQWRMATEVHNRRHHYCLSGVQNSYGRGLSIDVARASNLMEVLERYASFASIQGEAIPGYQTEFNLRHGAYSSLQGKKIKVLYPNSMCLEVPYEDEELYWMPAQTNIEGSMEDIWIPAQAVFLFCNLDEPALFSGLGSTGLASGSTLAQAKVSALLEVIERDAEATKPFDYSRCFRAETNDPEVGKLLAAYAQCGIDVMFQDITSRFGVPCCKCFVKGQDGSIAKGVGAHLTAKRALMSATTETPYSFPKGPPSMQGPDNLLMVPLENLPDYSTGDPETDLALLEAILSENDLHPIYVDLTRKDTGIPVVRAIVPGLEIMADFDAYSRISPVLFYNYLEITEQI